MSAASSVSIQSALFADQNYAKRMPFSMPSTHNTTDVATPASISIIETDVTTSVSLFALVLSFGIILLVVLLSLSGLTGLISLVGLNTGLDPGIAQGD
ncbi:MAG: hypothetical protein M3Z24_01285 [Chloroflexota bacterium]|nr:hypothetical protein [Chloroflexota bacterium]